MNINNDIFFILNQLPVIKFLNMKEDEIDWIFVKNEIIHKGCRINENFGPLIYEPKYRKKFSLNYCDLNKLNMPNLVTKSYIKYSKKKNKYDYDTFKLNSRFDEKDSKSNHLPFIKRKKMKRFTGSLYDFRKLMTKKQNLNNRVKLTLTYDKYSDLIFMGDKCRFFIMDILTSYPRKMAIEERKKIIIDTTKDAHKKLVRFVEQIAAGHQSLVLTKDHEHSLENRIFAGCYLVFKKINEISHRRFSLPRHLNRCANEDCSTGFFISHHKLVDSSCSSSCTSKINNSSNSPIYKEKL